MMAETEDGGGVEGGGVEGGGGDGDSGGGVGGGRTADLYDKNKQLTPLFTIPASRYITPTLK